MRKECWQVFKHTFDALRYAPAARSLSVRVYSHATTSNSARGRLRPTHTDLVHRMTIVDHRLFASKEVLTTTCSTVDKRLLKFRTVEVLLWSNRDNAYGFYCVYFKPVAATTST